MWVKSEYTELENKERHLHSIQPTGPTSLIVVLGLVVLYVLKYLPHANFLYPIPL